jgi:hypothetical protein
MTVTDARAMLMSGAWKATENTMPDPAALTRGQFRFEAYAGGRYTRGQEERRMVVKDCIRFKLGYLILRLFEDPPSMEAGGTYGGIYHHLQAQPSAPVVPLTIDLSELTNTKNASIAPTDELQAKAVVPATATTTQGSAAVEATVKAGVERRTAEAAKATTAAKAAKAAKAAEAATVAKGPREGKAAEAAAAVAAVEAALAASAGRKVYPVTLAGQEAAAKDLETARALEAVKQAKQAKGGGLAAALEAQAMRNTNTLAARTTTQDASGVAATEAQVAQQRSQDALAAIAALGDKVTIKATTKDPVTGKTYVTLNVSPEDAAALGIDYDAMTGNTRDGGQGGEPFLLNDAVTGGGGDTPGRYQIHSETGESRWIKSPVGYGMLDGNNYDGGDAMIKAACYGQVGIVKMLVKQNMRLDPKDKNGHTPLHWAQAKGQPQIAKILTKALAQNARKKALEDGTGGDAGSGGAGGGGGKKKKGKKKKGGRR